MQRFSSISLRERHFTGTVQRSYAIPRHDKRADRSGDISQLPWRYDAH